MAHRAASEASRKRILSACVRLFIEQGYHKTTVAQIMNEARVSSSSFQNLFESKGGVLLSLTETMFAAQFEAVEKAESDIKPLFGYAAETAIQLTVTELNENIRECYVEAYSNEAALEYVYSQMAPKLEMVFSKYNPGLELGDYYEFDIGSAGMMRGYMSRKCDQYFTLERKLEKFLTMTLRSFNVPQKEIDEALTYVLSMDIRAISEKILDDLFRSLEVKFDFKFSAK